MKAVAITVFLTINLSNLCAGNTHASDLAQDQTRTEVNLEYAKTPAAPFITIPNAKAPFPNSPSANILVGGQPSLENIRAAHQAGYKTIINLRPKGEFKAWDEAALAEQLGINYILIPVGGESDITTENAQRLDQALQARAHSPTIVHCASGNRVGALFALRAQLQGSDPKTAMAVGRSAGLSSLAPLVKKILQP